MNMTGMQLERLRRDAMNQGVLPQLPGTSRSALEHQSNCQYVASVASCSAVQQPLPKFTLRIPKAVTKIEITVTVVVETETITRPIPHPRPRYIYGDLYAPEYRQSLEAEDRPRVSNPNKPRMSFQDVGRMCKYCAGNAGWPCIRLVPCMTGVRSAREVLISRALMEVPQKRKGRVPPKPSPLQMSFAAGSLNSQSPLHGLGALSDLTNSDRTSIFSSKDLAEELESILANADLVRGCSGRLFSTCFDGLDNNSISFSGGSCSPGDETELDYTSEECDNDDLSSLENFHGSDDELDELSWVGSRVTFTEPPLVERERCLTRQSLSVKASKLSRATISRCNHLRYARSAFFKRNSRSFS